MVELKEKPAVKTAARHRGGSTVAEQGLFSRIARAFISAALTGVNIILCLIATFFALEFIFSLAHIGEDTVARPDTLLGYAHLENQTVTFRSEGYSRSTINWRGFRDALYAVPKPADVYRVCITGDSMTMGLEVPLDKTFPKLLEKRLGAEGKKIEGKRIEVLNCGMSGSGTGQQYLGYRQNILPLQPDMLIVAYHLGDNDDNIGGGTNPPRPTFLLGPNGHLQVDFKDVDTWLAGADSRFYSSCDWFRRHCRTLAVLSKMDLDLHADPTYRQISKVAGKPLSLLWSAFLNGLPAGDWRVSSSRAVARDLLESAQADSVQPPQKPLTKPASNPKQVGAAAPLAASTPVQANHANDFLDRPENGDLKAYRGLLYVHTNRMAVTKEIFRRLNAECRQNNCKFVIAALPAFDNSIMYYREVNELAAEARNEHFGFINSCPIYPPRGPLDDSPFHFGIHFNCAGHARMSDLIYNTLFASNGENH